ncbi:MAG: protein kinase, partial [Gammaproteobacteria bacterium]|nr:protein kinase [Gammaproteobacteria bacterium]
MSVQNEIYKNGFLLGEWRVSPMQGELRGPSGSQHIEPKVMKLLLCLAERHGEVVERDTLIDVVWDGRVVSDEALFRCVAELRKRLGDSRKNPRYIRTVHKIGYQLVSAVSFEDADSKSVSSVDEPAILHWPHLQRFDNLEVIRHLGSGLMAHVHLARDIALERLVAIKTLRSDLNMSSNARQRFYREAKAAARLNHPNVTAIYRIGELSSDRPYIVQQFVEGKNLAELIEVEGALEIGYAISLLRELAAALAEAHHERIIHRDLKPGNILIEADSGRALLSDFGIAGIQETGRRDATQLTLAGEMLGEPRYMSPEQVRGEKATAQCDIYSYGLVAFEILSGRYAYD